MTNIITGLISHQFEERTVRTSLNQSGDPLFVAKDVCEVLGISKYRDAISNLDDDERVSIKTDTLGGSQDMVAVTESGLSALIFQSRKPEAKRFRKWVTSEVLPTLRKTGAYTTNPAGGYLIAGPTATRVALLQCLLRAERSILLNERRREAILRGEHYAPSTNPEDRGLPAAELAGAVPVHGWLRERGVLEEPRRAVLAQRLRRRLLNAGLPLGKMRNEANCWVLTAQPEDLAAHLQPADLSEKGGL